jgi:hypothetical protein
MTTLATHFHFIIAIIQAAIAPVANRERARTAFLVLVWNRLARTATRFENLYARWRANTLPKPRTPRAPRPYTSRDRPRVPTRHMWLIREVQGTAYGHAALPYLFARPDFAEFLAAAPQAGRILRPLCHALGVILPPELIQPPRPEAKPPATTQPNPGETDTKSYLPPPHPPSTSRPRVRPRNHVRHPRC